MVYEAPAEHLSVVEICMPLHIPVMIEKPLAFTNEDAARIKFLSEKFKTKVYTNFPSIWYSSFIELLKRSNEAGTINKMVMRGGHRGPIEVGCSKQFLNWLTDSIKNGGGALVDFGCYGAAIMTELMHGKLPVSVYAATRHLKPTCILKRMMPPPLSWNMKMLPASLKRHGIGLILLWMPKFTVRMAICMHRSLILLNCR